MSTNLPKKKRYRVFALKGGDWDFSTRKEADEWAHHIADRYGTETEAYDTRGRWQRIYGAPQD